MLFAEFPSSLLELWQAVARYPLSASEALSVLTGLACVWLTVRQHPACWPVGIANNLFLSAVCWSQRLYALLALQQVYVVLGVYGWYHWSRGGTEDARLAVRRTPAATWGMLAVLAPAATWALAEGLIAAARFLEQDPPVRVVWDSATTACCLIAQWMLARKLVETWPLWIATNVSYVFLYGVQQQYLLAAVQIPFIALSIAGWREWSRSLAVEP